MSSPSYLLVKNAKHFSLNENWGIIDKVHSTLIQRLIFFRDMLGAPVHISPRKGAVYATKGHSNESYHYIIQDRNEFAMAADVFPDCDLMTAWMCALHSGFFGVGVYPFWTWKDKSLIGGLHLDIREQDYITGWWQDDLEMYHTFNKPQDFEALEELL